ncbi:hypothetical protein EDB85DRAFT_2294715, partial [Lactarius pseudohatsudake]
MFVIVIVGIPRSHSGVDESLQQHHHRRGLVVGIFPPNDRTACLHYTPHKHALRVPPAHADPRALVQEPRCAPTHGVHTTIPCLNRMGFETLRASFV